MSEDVDRAVSTTVAYVLTLSIAALAISGLLIAAGGYVNSEREQTAREELRVIGQRLATDVESLDRLAASSDDNASSLSIEREFPDDVTGVSYLVEVQPGPPTILRLYAPELDIEVLINVRTQIPVAASTVNGGSVLIEGIDTDGDPYVDELEVSNG